MLVNFTILIVISLLTLICHIRNIPGNRVILTGMIGLLLLPLFNLIDSITKYQDILTITIYLVTLSGILLIAFQIRRSD